MHSGLHNSLQHAMANGRQVDKEILMNWSQFYDEKEKRHSKVIPAVEIILSMVEINSFDPGYQKPSIRVQTIFHGSEGMGKGKRDH